LLKGLSRNLVIWQFDNLVIMYKVKMQNFIATGCLLLLHIYVFSQGVGFNTTGTPAENSAILDVSSTSQGLLIPRMTTVQRDGIVSPALSLLIFNTTTNCFESFVNGVWYSVSCPPCNPPASPIPGSHLPTTNSIVWKWNTVSGATGYKWSTNETEAEAKDNGANTSFTQSGLNCKTSYSLFVWSYNSCGKSSSIMLSQLTSCCSNVCQGDGTFTDARDGQTYGYVNIGTQTWMCQNLNYGTFTSVVNTPQQTGYKFCQDLTGNNNYCCPMGGLYEWANMMNGSGSCNGTDGSNPACYTPVQGLCPTGWHVPTHYEWTLLEKNVGSNPDAFPYDETTTNVYLGTDEGANVMEAGTNHWVSGNIGTNTSRFTALGNGSALNGSLYSVGTSTTWWTATEWKDDTSAAWNRGVEYFNPGILRYTYTKAYGFAVRCVKD
jgi:uncharacterized protein (TIGR02145 family)